MTQQLPAAVDIAILAGNPSPTELAALTAVLSGVLEELAGEQRRAESTGVSAWQRGQRPIRLPLRPGPGAWRDFPG